ncbi:hypothetical protein MLD38_038006 [Melastoma candidum]|uniref:Uncharacterized protein n=1 Tax=Melastoma candidum TaxID=119954 RepID=A0ACB9KY85_9MYRT|nr:hypothetical protein MLD38_038006 [Melastoma candidum]
MSPQDLEMSGELRWGGDRGTASEVVWPPPLLLMTPGRRIAAVGFENIRGDARELIWRAALGHGLADLMSLRDWEVALFVVCTCAWKENSQRKTRAPLDANVHPRGAWTRSSIEDGGLGLVRPLCFRLSSG